MGQHGMCLEVMRQGTRRHQCPFHGLRVRSGVHWDTCRNVVKILYQEHAQVVVLPELCVTRKHKSVTKVHKVDVLAVFSSGRSLTVEVDGLSYYSTMCVGMDTKEKIFLCQQRIEVPVHNQIGCELDDLRQCARSIIL